MSVLLRGVMNVAATDGYSEKVLLLPELSSTRAYELSNGAFAVVYDDRMKVPCHISVGNKVLGRASEQNEVSEVYFGGMVESFSRGEEVNAPPRLDYRGDVNMIVNGSRGGLINQPVIRISMDGNAVAGTLRAFYVLVFDDFSLTNDVRQEIFESQL